MDIMIYDNCMLPFLRSPLTTTTTTAITMASFLSVRITRPAPSVVELNDVDISAAAERIVEMHL